LEVPISAWVHIGGAGGVHPRGLVQAVAEEVAVPVEGHRRRGVTEHLPDDLDVGSGRAGRGVRARSGVGDRPPRRLTRKNLVPAMTEVCVRYDPTELRVITEFLTASDRCQQEASARLRSATGGRH
jgi:hypothetical protein